MNTSDNKSADQGRPPRGWRKFWFVLKVIQVRLRFVALLVLSGLAISYWDHVVSWWEKYNRPPGAQHAAETDHEFFCPMHTFIVRSDPGKCPICGMPLVQRKRGAKEELPAGVLGRVQVSPERIAQAGVEVVSVDYRVLARETRAVGTVDYNEKKLTRITARFPGRIEQLYADYVGVTVKKGDPLARVYSPKYLAATQEFVQGLALGRSMSSNATPDERNRAKALADLARQRLLLAGFEPEQLREIERTGKAAEVITYYSKASGVVISKDILQGEYVGEGQTLYTVADLGSVWVQVQAPESDAALARLKAPVELMTVAHPGKVFYGTIDFVAPVIDTDTRTLRVRIEVANPAGELRPGMYATAIIRSPIGRFEQIGGGAETTATAAGGGKASDGAQTTGTASGGAAETWGCEMCPEVKSSKPGECPKCGMELTKKQSAEPTELRRWAEGYTCAMHPEFLGDKPGKCTVCPCEMEMTRWRVEKTLSIPERSVIDTGTRKIVYVEAAPGVFEAHEVQLGPRAGQYYPILAGLDYGQKIVAAGSFLVDAENRLNPAPGSLYSAQPAGAEEGGTASEPQPADGSHAGHETHKH